MAALRSALRLHHSWRTGARILTCRLGRGVLPDGRAGSAYMISGPRTVVRRTFRLTMGLTSGSLICAFFQSSYFMGGTEERFLSVVLLELFDCFGDFGLLESLLCVFDRRFGM